MTGNPEAIPGRKAVSRKFHHIGNDKRASRHSTPGWSANRKLSRHGLLGRCQARCSAKVKSFARNDRFVIALHSPIGVAETGLPVCPSEKMAAKPTFGVERDSFSSPVSERESRNCGIFKRFSGECSLVSLRPRLNGGGCSPVLTSLRREFAANSENNREFCDFRHGFATPKLVSARFHAGYCKIAMKRNRELSGA